MNNLPVFRCPTTICWNRILSLVLLNALVIWLMPTSLAPVPRASAEVLAQVARNPDQVMDVIVQKSAYDAGPEASVERLGGRITGVFHVINGFAARLRASAIPALARSSGVRWVSIDAPLHIDTMGAAMDYMGAWECTGADPTSYVIETANPHTGAYDVKLTAALNVPARCEERTRVQPNTTYIAVAWMKSSTLNLNGAFDITAMNGQGQPVAGEHYTAIGGNTASYQPTLLTFTTGSNSVFLSVAVSVSTAGGSIYLDDVSLRRASDLDTLMYNQLLNPGFEYGLSAGWLCPLKYAQEVSGSPGADQELQLTNNGKTVPRCEQGVNVEAGQQYRLSARIRTAPQIAGGTSGQVGAASGSAILGQVSTQETSETSASTIISVPTNANRITLYLQAVSDPKGSAYFDDIALQKCIPSSCGTAASPNLVANPGFEYRTMMLNAYNKIIRQDLVPERLSGKGITVAVIDSGMASHPDLATTTAAANQRIIAATVSILNADPSVSPSDEHGHGTHVAGIIGGNGASSKGIAIGVAPEVDFVSLKIFGPDGRGSTRDFVNALEWIYNNRTRYNIRVVSMSLSSSTTEHYSTNPLSAAIEILWKNGIVVVCSVGNQGTPGAPVELRAPANDPFIITVGATWDKGTPEITDDLLADYSAFGTIMTTNGLSIAKPDLVAPGSRIMSLSAGNNTTVKQLYPYQSASGFTGAGGYYRMSGTSMAAPVVAGAVALLLQNEPRLTADQVKDRLIRTAQPLNLPNDNQPMPGTGAGYVDLYAAISSTSTASANQSIPLNQRVYNNATNPGYTWTNTDWSNISWTDLDYNGQGLGGSDTYINVDWEAPRP